MKAASAVALGLLTALARADPTWPNRKIDALEDLMFLQSGMIRFGILDGVTPCGFAPAGNGRNAAAEWLRTAFHDFATHDAATGTGGLDASIAYETDRAENPGAAFNSTLGFLLNGYSGRVSMADMIALGVYVSVRTCGGPDVPIRAGRVDATGAGVSGVPEPQQNITSIKDRFQGAGFNASDMIALTACGHTLGGVHGEDFPQITGSNSTASFPKFDSTHTSFDPAIASSYLAGNTTNPLVVGPAETNSDARVFAADGNITISTMTDPAVFKTRCPSVLQRMIDTVPKGVELSDPIKPYTIKPYQTQLTLKADGTLTFTGYIRVRVTGLTGDQFTVTLPYKRRDGLTCADCVISTTRGTFQGGYSLGFGESFVWYQFSAVLPTSTSISSFTVVVTGAAGTTTYTNNGGGYPVTDSIIYQAAQSCLGDTDQNGNGNLIIVAAVRDGTSTTASLDLSVKTPRQGSIVPPIVRKSVALEKWESVPGTGYSLYRASTLLALGSRGSDFDVTLGTGTSKMADEFKKTTALAGTVCQPLA